VERVATAITASGASSALAALASAYTLPLDLVSRRGAVAIQPERIESGERVAGGNSFPPAAWSGWLPPSFTALPLAPEVHCLFGVALGLATAPSQVRSSSAVAEARRWWHAVAGGPRPARDISSTASADSTTRLSTVAPASGATRSPHVDPGRAVTEAAPPDAIDARQAVPAASVPEPVAAGSDPGPAPPSASRADLRFETASEPRAHADCPESAIEPRIAADASVEAVQAAPEDREAGAADRRQRDAANVPVRPPGAVAAWPVPPPSAAALPARSDAAAEEADFHTGLASDGVVTDLGGVLFLVHALEDLSLPLAFERRWKAATLAGPWGTLDLIGRALLGPRLARVRRDPMWRTLALLAGWEERKAGRRLRDPARTARPGRLADPAYRAPTDWLARLDDSGERFFWAVREGRLWLWSEEGYLVGHYRCRHANDATAARALARVLAPGHPAPRVTRAPAATIPWLPPSLLPVGCPPRLGRWAAAVAPVVRRRLLLALGFDPREPGRAPGDSIADRLSLRARLYVTSSHIDVVMDIDRADLAVRRAGLDRDPGWLPAYGRVIYFHFQ
jgi:hypothetical protein